MNINDKKWVTEQTEEALDWLLKDLKKEIFEAIRARSKGEGDEIQDFARDIEDDIDRLFPC